MKLFLPFMMNAVYLESIAESEASSLVVRQPLLPTTNRLQRVLAALRDALPHIVVFAIGASSNMPLQYETVKRLTYCGLASFHRKSC